MSERKYTSSVPMDLLVKGAEGRVASAGAADRDPVWFLPRNEEIVVSFLADPKSYGPKDWFPFREAQAKGVLIPGTWNTGEYAGTPRGELPWRMQEIPVEDVETVIIDGEPKYKYRRPYLEVAPGQLLNVVDDIIDARSQRFPGENGRTNVEWSVLVNVIVWAWPDGKKKDGSAKAKPAVGEHIVLKMPKRAAQMIIERLIDRVDDNPDLNLADWKWRVTLVGGKPNTLVLKRDEKLETPLDVEPFDLGEIVVGRLERFENHIKAAFADMATSVAPSAGESPMDSSEEPEREDPLGDAEAHDLLNLMTTAALRSRLKKAEVDIPSGASREKLLELAAAHLV